VLKIDGYQNWYDSYGSSRKIPPFIVLINTSQEVIMTMWNKILALLDAQFGFQSTKASSKVKKMRQGYDNQTNELVIWLEYRVRVKTNQPSQSATKTDPKVLRQAAVEKQRSVMNDLIARSNRLKRW
jgi:hypothetical protein